MINEGNNMKDITVHHYRILAVDDNEACAKTMMWTMEMLGHNARFALNGPTAITLAKTFLPDLVLLDADSIFKCINSSIVMLLNRLA